MKKIITLLVIICMMFTTLVHNVYGDDVINPLYQGCDFYIFTDEFMSAYKEGEFKTGFFQDKDLNNIDGLELTYDNDNGEYTLNVTKDVTLKANKDICSFGFQDSNNSMIFVNEKILNIVGGGTLSLVIATDDFTNDYDPICIYIWKGALNIGTPNSETRTKLKIEDESSSSCQINSFGMYCYRGNISINNSNIEIRTSKAGMVVTDTTDYKGTLNINDSDIYLICKDNNTFNDYYGISDCPWIPDHISGDYNFNDTNLTFYGSYQDDGIEQPIHCMETTDKVIMDSCKIDIQGEVNSLICAGECCEDSETCIKIIDSTIIAACTAECINSMGHGDLIIKDSYIDLRSVSESAIKVCNNIIVTYTPEGSKNYGSVVGDVAKFGFSIKTNEHDHRNAICYYEYAPATRYGTRDKEEKHKMTINIAPTLNIYYSEYSDDESEFTADTLLFDDILYNTDNIKEIILDDGVPSSYDSDDSDEFKHDCLSLKKVAAVIHFDSNGGEPNYDPIIIENYGDIDLNNYKPTKSGYEFGGWYPFFAAGTEKEFPVENEFLSDYVDGNFPANYDHTFIAKWIKKSGGQSSGSGKHIVLDTGVN